MTRRRANLKKLYGNPGEPDCFKGKALSPYPLKLSWDLSTSIQEIPCHVKIQDGVSEVLENVYQLYSEKEIEEYGLNIFGGCYNYRKQRNGTKLSTHSWGIALDFDPLKNQLDWRSSKAKLADEYLEPWWRCWETRGFYSTGREHNYDWMHIQFGNIF